MGVLPCNRQLTVTKQKRETNTRAHPRQRKLTGVERSVNTTQWEQHNETPAYCRCHRCAG